MRCCLPAQPELGPAKVLKTAPVDIGRHSFDLNVSLNKPGRIHWAVLDAGAGMMRDRLP